MSISNGNEKEIIEQVKKVIDINLDLKENKSWLQKAWF